MIRYLAVYLALALSGTAIAMPGDLDPTFGDGGIRLVGEIPERPIQALVMQGDGRLLALVPGNDSYLPPFPPSLWRLNPDGTPDASFGIGGKFDFEGIPRRPDYLLSPHVLAAPDAMGRTTVALWEAGVVADKGSYFVSVSRVLADGTLDRSFGDQGKGSVLVADDGNFPPTGIVVQADGRILVVTTSEDFTSHGRPAALVRFLDNGTADAAFGDKGYLRLPFNAQVAAVAQQPDGKLLLAGRDYGYPPLQIPEVRTVIARVLPDGQLDTSFADAGVFLDPRGSAILPLALTIQPDRNVVVAGSAIGFDGNEQMALLRLDPQGRADPSFGDLGRVVYTVEPGYLSDGSEVAIDTRGRILVTGSVFPVPPPSSPYVYDVRRIAVARFQRNGAPDLRFAGGGSTTIWAGYGAVATGLVIRTGDSILLAGGVDGAVRYIGAGLYARTPRAALFALNGGDGAIERPIREAIAVEYFHAGFGHYFISALPSEIALLDVQSPPDWTRTGRTFHVWSGSAPDLAVVCRFFSGSTFAPKSSHFFTPYADECSALRRGTDWQYEGDAFNLRLPVGPPGARTCPQDTVALYRAYNNGRTGAPNHRYTTDRKLLDQLILDGWTMEGEAQTSIFACVPAP